MLPKSFVLKPAFLFSSLSQQQQQKFPTSETFLVMIFQSTQNFCIFSKKSKMPRNKKNSSWWSPIKTFHWKNFCFHLNFGRRKCKELLLGSNNSRMWALPTVWVRFMLLGFVSYGISMFIGFLGYQKKASGTLSWPTRLTCWDSPVSASCYQYDWILSNPSLSDSYFQSFMGQNKNQCWYRLYTVDYSKSPLLYQRSNTGSLDL